MYDFLNSIKDEQARIYTIPKVWQGKIYSVEATVVRLAIGEDDPTSKIAAIAINQIVAVEEL